MVDSQRQRLREAMGRRFDPYAVALIRRAGDIARARNSTEVTLQDVLQAMLFRPVTAGIVDAVLDAGSVAADRAEDHVGELHLLVALTQNELSALSQLLPSLGIDRTTLIGQLHDLLDAGNEWDRTLREDQAGREG